MRRRGRVLALLVVGGLALGGMSGVARGGGSPLPDWEIDLSSVFCDPALGEWQVTFGFRSNEPGVTVTFVSVVVAGSGADVVGSFAPNPFESTSWTYGTALLPGSAVATGEITVTYLADGAPGSFMAPGIVWTPASPCGQIADLVVAPAVVSGGDVVTISGTGCLQPPPAFAPGGDSVAPSNGTPISGTVTGTVGFAPPVGFGPITAAPDGTWSTTIVVPAGTPSGSYSATATCSYPPIVNPVAVGAQAVTATSFDYRTRTVVVPVVAPPRFAG